MELIAASRIPKASARVLASKPYTAKLIEVIQNLGVAGGGSDHLLLAKREVKRAGVLVVSSDRGLAGAYASTIIRMAEQRIIDLRREGKDDEVMTMAFFDGTREEYEEARDDLETMAAEERRLRRISEVEERVLLSAVFELVEEVLPPPE